MLPHTPNGSDELGGLLQQHLSELDDSLANLTRSYGSVQDVGVEPSVSVPGTDALLSARPVPHCIKESLPPPSSPPSAPELPKMAIRLMENSGPAFDVEQIPSACAETLETLVDARPAHDPGLLEVLFQGIETKKLSTDEALTSLERACRTERAEVVQPEKSECQKEASSAPSERPYTRCRQCGVLGLQVRALAQSLSGLAARTVQWSAGLSHRRQQDLVDMVLCYLRPLEHLDERLETLCCELASAPWLADTPPPSSIHPPASLRIPTEASLGSVGAREHWQAEAGKDADLGTGQVETL
ncbi:unnamed protein product [Symbiodinium natans]|uniref:Uncharacterized protein n=1 Tax=Symbiodinium natans TaxID=878477 RepID=A0A812TV10_9DINO|nr:unnamed protein product [Symbiodinium natans]